MKNIRKRRINIENGKEQIENDYYNDDEEEGRHS